MFTKDRVITILAYVLGWLLGWYVFAPLLRWWLRR